jgi:hypothetical protein
VKDIDGHGDGTGIGVWDHHDPIVDATGLVDQLAREKQEILFRDGSIRSETIVKMIYESDIEDGFAPFLIDGSMEYPALFYPTPTHRRTTPPLSYTPTKHPLTMTIGSGRVRKPRISSASGSTRRVHQRRSPV